MASSVKALHALAVLGLDAPLAELHAQIADLEKNVADEHAAIERRPRSSRNKSPLSMRRFRSL